jgi:hypothetical protein
MKRNPALRTQRPSIPPHVYESLLESVYSKILTHSRGGGGLISPASGGRDLITEWDLLKRYARGDYLLTEGQWARGQLLLEGFMEGLRNAFSWVSKGAGKIATGAVKVGKKVVEVTKEAINLGGKALVWALEKIPYAKELYEIISDFTKDKLSQIAKLVKDSVKDFKDWLVKKKNEIVGAVMTALADESSFLGSLKAKAEAVAKETKTVGKAMGSAAGEEITGFAESFKSDPIGVGLSILKIAGDSEGDSQIEAARKIFGSIFSNGIKKILSAGGKVADAIFAIFSAGGLFESKVGMLIFKMINLASSAGESFQQLADNAILLWGQIKKIGSNKLDIEHKGRTIKKLIPEIVYGLISGTSPIEGLLGNPIKYIGDLFKNLLTDIKDALIEQITTEGKEALCDFLDIDPNGKVVSAVFYVIRKMLGTDLDELKDDDGGGGSPAPART